MLTNTVGLKTMRGWYRLTSGANWSAVPHLLLPYDAGTDSGESYASRNAPMANPEKIHRIAEAPLRIDGTVPTFGTFTFTRLDN